MKRRTKKQMTEGKWTNVAQQILQHTSALALMLRDPLQVSLEQAQERMIAFREAFIKTGEGDVLPCSGENADIDGALCDVDTFNVVIDLLSDKIRDLECEAESEDS
jgi:hypothetical protein